MPKKLKNILVKWELIRVEQSCVSLAKGPHPQRQAFTWENYPCQVTLSGLSRQRVWLAMMIGTTGQSYTGGGGKAGG